MRFEQIPKINDVWDNVSITTLSPSIFCRVEKGCAFSLLLQKAIDTFNDKSLFLPVSKNVVLGTIVHKIYELTTKQILNSFTDLSVKWDSLISQTEKEIKTLYPTLNNINLNDYDKRNKCFRNVFKYIGNKSSNKTNDESDVRVFTEYRIDCSEIGLRGIIDKIRIFNGNVEITDYKSGSVLDDDGNIKEDYLMQMNLYAIMCEHNGLGNAYTTSLIDFDGNRFDIEYNSNCKKDYLTRVHNVIASLNDIVKNRTFENAIKTDVDRCSLCSVRHICEKQKYSGETQFATVIGFVSKIISPNLYEVEMSWGGKVYISGLERYSIEDDYYLNKKLSFVNLICSESNSDFKCYRVTDNTIIYELQ